MKRNYFFRKALAFLMALAMMISMIPSLALMDEETEGEDNSDITANVSLDPGIQETVTSWLMNSEVKLMYGDSETRTGFFVGPEDHGTVSWDRENGILFIENGTVALSSVDGKTIPYRIVVGGDATLILSDITIEKANEPAIEVVGNATIAGKLRTTKGHGIVISENTTLSLAGVDIEAEDGAAIKVKPSVTATIHLDNSSNSVIKGGSDYAGLEVGWSGSDNYATLNIEGSGTLRAEGGENSAGIGGSHKNTNESGEQISCYYGNIVIKNGTIFAIGHSGAGIGSGLNNNRNEDGTKNTSSSYRMTRNKQGEACNWGTIEIKGGTISAVGYDAGAGIGGGSHVDSGKIIISNGTIKLARGAGGGGAGIGSGIGSQKQESDFSKGPGYYYADITITGGSITAKSDWLGAGIGGGYACDAKINISNASINATGGNGNSGANYQGGPGIGAGYMGLPQLIIKSGSIRAKGGTGAPGIGYGAGALEGDTNKERGKDSTIKYGESYINISGGTINAEGGINAAGIGSGNGNQYCKIMISGGSITAKGYSDSSNITVGGAGIGSGTGIMGGSTKYKADTDLNISISGDAKITAIGGAGAAGIGSGSYNNSTSDTSVIINITGGESITASSEAFGAGIGSGIGSENCSVNISGGSIYAYGAESSKNSKDGGAAIGSASILDGTDETIVNVNISGGLVLANGGWGAAGIGSGANNIPANKINISGGEIEAYADGTKFAIDTRILNADETTTSRTEERKIKVPVLQGTFVHNYTAGAIEQNPEGLKSIILENDSTGAKARELTRMPAGYRSFAATVPSAGVYNVYTDSESIGQGGGRYFAEALKDVYNENELADIIQYSVTGNSLSDNFYLYPVKTFVVEKKMASETEGDSLSDINTTAYFNLVIDESQEIYKTDSIEIKDGKPQGRAYFVNVPDNNYEIWEVDGNGKNPVGQKFGKHILAKITTSDSSEGESNDGSITPEKWTDTVIVTNTYGLNIIDIDVTKVWSDNDNQDGIRPDSVTIQLLANGTELAGRTATLSAANNWTDSFTGLERQDDEGKDIVYTIRENTIAGYTAAITGTAVDGFTVTNMHKPDTTEVSVTKVWNDGSDQDGLRPESVTVRLLADGTETQNAVLSAANRWSYTFTGLPVNNAGKAIAYTITEDAVTGYTAEITGTAAAGFTVTNTHVPATTEVTVAKVWSDNNDQDGIRPANVTIRLLADGTEVRNAVLTGGESGWSHTFTELPLNNAGHAIAYTITEDAVTGYTTAITGTAAAGFTVTNTHTPDTTEVKVTKVWDDSDNQDAVRPPRITVRLLADGTEIQREILNPSNNWSCTFADLPVNNAGQAIAYTVTEDEVTGYTTAITGTAADGFTVTNTHTPDTTEVTVTKVWNDNSNQDGVRPENVMIRLLANGEEVRSAEITGTGDSWTYTFTELPRNSAGRAITYTITEDAVTGYTTAITGTAAAGFTVANTHTPDTTEVTVTKVWNDNDNQDAVRPARVTVRLLAEGTEVRSAEITGAGSSWSHTFTDLPRNSAGRAIAYTITEDTVDGYTAAITGTAATGFTVTNTHNPDTTEVTVTKAWNDNSNQDGVRPENVTIRLLANGEEVRNAEITGTGDSWTYTFTELPRNSAGRAITYTITEDAVTGYTTAITGTAAAGFTVANTHTPDTTEVIVTKVWNDSSNQDGVRPENVTIHLMANGTEARSAEITGTGNSWSYTFTELPRNSGGRAIAYTVTEDTVTGHTTAITGTAAAGFTVTNTHNPDTTEVTVTKAWNDNSNQDGVRPENVTIRLLANGTEVRSAEITGTGDSWTYTFADLPRNSAGRAITYTIAEDTVTGYTTAITGTAAAGFTVTNTHTPDTTEVTVTKAWNDNSNQDGIRPENVTIRLMANGTEVRSAEITGTGESWSYTFTDLPRNSAGRAITYSITEDAVTGYTTAITGTAADEFTVTNTHEPAAIQVTVAKVWNDNNNQDGIRPAAVTVNLMANGTQVRTQRVTGNGNRWTYTFTDLPQFENGTEIVYTVNENAVTGYTAAITGTAAAGFTLTNTHAPEVISVSGRKTWADQNNTDGIRPASITVHLLADGRQTETRTVTDDTYMFENLPRFINGREIVYSISEDPVEGYTTEINGYDLTNRHTPLRISINGAKVWGDHENRDGLRPQAITVHLLADGQEVGSQRVTGAGDRWTYSFANLPAYADGKLIRYTVTEDAVEGYETTVVGHEIYNVHRNEDPDADPELYTLTVRYWADGQTAFPDFRGTYEFGAMYSVVSPEKPGYTVDLEVVAGVIVEDTVIDVYYNPKPVTLTIYYQYMDGSIAGDTYFDTLMPGVPYDVVSPVIEDFTATQLRVEGIMPNRNTEFVVWYLPETEPDPETGRTRIPGGYTKIDDYGVPLGLGNVNRNVGECVE